MKNVMLICEDGISSNFLVKSAKLFIETYHADIHLIPSDFENANKYFDEGIDLVLIAPQAVYHEKELSLLKNRIKVLTIPDDVYGWANGEKLVKFIVAQFKSAKAV
ncbi:hypothetical protein YK48G_00150 [Lentilactobacillus fungorum]|uniref:PTS EIIB type-3 domain-containing protein n=1 Tax=Lentilactobacillus fungorum TaxID=2201250 RepID=A0ABQ3VUK2_9LACO|nr:PTS lactose transporter subunit IIB [Lentilactobacillus fungorum]GHP12590.1 hypothetical protein YK48G_00150 [Lentilactobacillus fungorum]